MSDRTTVTVLTFSAFEAGDEAVRLAALLREPACFVGVGNPLRRDDGFGPWLAGAVRPALAGTGVEVVDAQDVPENFAPVVARSACRSVIVADIVAAPGPPGSVIFGRLDSLGEIEGFSTHQLALTFTRRFLEAAGKTVFLLGVVPAELGFGLGLTPAVAATAEGLRRLIVRAAPAATGPE